MSENLEVLNKFNFLLIYNTNSKEEEKQYHEYLSHLDGKFMPFSRNVKLFLNELCIKSYALDEKTLRKIPNIFETLPDSYEHFVVNKYLIDCAANLLFSEQLIKLISLNLNIIIENKKFLHVSLTFLAILFTNYFKNSSKMELENTKKYLLEYLDDFRRDDFVPKDIAIFKHLKFLLDHQDNLIRAKMLSFCDSLNIPLSLTKMICLSKKNANENLENLILFIGPTGSGKTTVINYLNGVEYQRHHLYNFLTPKKGYTNILQVGYGSSSETMTPQCVRLENLDLCDTAGFFDNRDGDIGICSALSIPIIVSHSKKVQAIVVVIESESLDFSKGNRGEIFRKVCQSFGQLIIDFDNNQEKIKNVLFVINDKSNQILSKDEFKQKIENFLVQYDQEVFGEKTSDLITQYSLKVTKLCRKLETLSYCNSMIEELKHEELKHKELKSEKYTKFLMMFINDLILQISEYDHDDETVDILKNQIKILENSKGLFPENFNIFEGIESELMHKICETQDEINKLNTWIKEKRGEQLISSMMLNEFKLENEINNEVLELIESQNDSEINTENKIKYFLAHKGIQGEHFNTLVKMFYEKKWDDFLQMIHKLMEKKQNIFLIKCVKSNDQQEDDKEQLISRLKDICSTNSGIDKNLFYFSLHQKKFEKLKEFIENSIEEINNFLSQLNALYENAIFINENIQITKKKINIDEGKLKELMSLKENLPYYLTKESFGRYNFYQTQIEIQKQLYIDIYRNIEYLETSIDSLEKEECVDFGSDCLTEKQNTLGKILSIFRLSWIYDHSHWNPRNGIIVPIERVELSCIKDRNGKIVFKTPIRMAQKDEYRILNEKGKFYQDHDLGLIEIAPGIQQVKILSNKKNLFTSTGNFKIKKNHLAKGILKVEYYSDDIDECYASVRVFVKPKEFEDNKNFILSKQNSIETFRKNLEKVKLKIQELERDQEDEKLILEALKKGINSSEKTDQLINILETLGYTKQEFLGNFFPQFPEVSKLEDVSYLNTIQSLLDLSDDDLAERYKLNKSQLRFYFYGDEAENRTVFAKESLFGVIGRDKLSSLINAAHSTGVSFLILNRILSKLNNNQNDFKRKDLKAKLASLKEEREEQINELYKWKAKYEKENKKVELLDYILGLFESLEGTDQLNRKNLLNQYFFFKNCETIKNILDNNFDIGSFLRQDTCDKNEIIMIESHSLNEKENEMKAIEYSSESESSLESASLNFQRNLPVKNMESLNSISDDFKLEYISFENDQNAYCASICINRITSAKSKMNEILEFYLPQLIQSAKKEKFINERDQTYKFIIEKLLLTAAASKNSIWVKMYWHLNSEIEHLRKYMNTGFEKDIDYFDRLLDYLIHINSDLNQNQKLFFDQLNKLNLKLGEQFHLVENFEVISAIHHLFDFKEQIADIDEERSIYQNLSTKIPIKICLEHYNTNLNFEKNYYYFVYKTNFDCRLDHLIQQSKLLIDNILRKNDINLEFFNYNVVSVGFKKALIELNQDTFSIMEMIDAQNVNNLEDFVRLKIFPKKDSSSNEYRDFFLVYRRSVAGFILINYLYGLNQSLDKILINKFGNIFCIELTRLYTNELIDFFDSLYGSKEKKFLFDMFNENQIKGIVELVVESFLILRKERKILINFFSLMQNSTITKYDLERLISRFLESTNENEIEKVFMDKIIKIFFKKEKSSYLSMINRIFGH